MIIVDTTVWIDYFGGTANDHTTWLDQQLGRQPLGLTDLILCETLQGIGSDATFRYVRSELIKLQVFSGSSSGIAIAAAQNYRSLRKLGHTVRKTIDCLIATFCIEEGHLLLHRDRDFDIFENHLHLHVVHP
jgi:hypothetical protein